MSREVGKTAGSDRFNLDFDTLMVANNETEDAFVLWRVPLPVLTGTDRPTMRDYYQYTLLIITNTLGSGRSPCAAI